MEISPKKGKMQSNRVMLVVTVVLVLSLGLVLLPGSAAQANLGWTEHTIKGDFDGAYSVYATDVDGDGDTDVLGAAYGADDITWWENGPPPAAPPPAAPPGEEVGEVVGGDVYPINKAILLAPWIALAAAIIAGGIILRHRRAHSYK